MYREAAGSWHFEEVEGGKDTIETLVEVLRSLLLHVKEHKNVINRKFIDTSYATI